jgi:thioredoxin-related protein
MERFRILVFLLMLLTCGLNSAAAAERIEWHGYDAGMSRSKFENKKVFLFFYAEWCVYCRDMDHKTFKDPNVIGTLNRDFIAIRVDSDREQAAAALFKVKGLPDSWFLAESGDIIGHRPGFIPADQLMKILNVIRSGSAGK